MKVKLSASKRKLTNNQCDIITQSVATKKKESGTPTMKVTPTAHKRKPTNKSNHLGYKLIKILD